MDQTEEAWKRLSNFPKSCASSHRCFNLSPHHEFCSTQCEDKYAADCANAARASEEQAEAKRASAARAEAELTSAKHLAASSKKNKTVKYLIGDGEILAKSVLFCVNEELLAIGQSLNRQDTKIADIVFLTSRTHDECNTRGNRNHRHNMKCAK